MRYGSKFKTSISSLRKHNRKHLLDYLKKPVPVKWSLKPWNYENSQYYIIHHVDSYVAQYGGNSTLLPSCEVHFTSKKTMQLKV